MAAAAGSSLDALGLDATEQAAATALVQALPDVATPSRAVRFLRARKGDADAATDFLTEHLAWRAANLPIAIEDARPELARLKYTPLVCRTADGRTPDGRYVLCIRSRLMGKHSYESIEDAAKAIIWIFEFLERHVLAPLEKVTVLMSRVGAGPQHFDPAWIKTVGRLLQANYPERLFECHVAPVPLIFRGVWETVKWFLDPATRAKVVLHGDVEAFGKVVPADALPEELGGTAEDCFSVASWLREPDAGGLW